MNFTRLPRRSFLQVSALALAAPVLARPILVTPAMAAVPWRARVIQGQFDGNKYHMGLAVGLDSGWRTYWRVPGAGGIAPDFTLHGDNLSGFEFTYPVPTRLHVGDEEIIGYEQNVVFPFTVSPLTLEKPLQLSLKAFLGVCETVCIPAQIEIAFSLSPANGPSPDAALLAQWEARVPSVSAEGAVTSAELASGTSGPSLKLTLAESVQDVFIVPKSSLYYFRAPVIEGRTATLGVDGAKSVDELRGQELAVIIPRGNGGLEQHIVLR